MADNGEPKSMTVKERLALMKKQAEDAKAAKEAAVPAPRANPVRKWSVPGSTAINTPETPSATTAPANATTPQPSSILEKDTGDTGKGSSSVSKLAAGLGSGIKFGAPPAGFRLPSMGMGNASPPAAPSSSSFSLSSSSTSSSTQTTHASPGEITDVSPGEITHINLTRAKLTTPTPRKRSSSTKFKLSELESAGISMSTESLVPIPLVTATSTSPEEPALEYESV